MIRVSFEEEGIYRYANVDAITVNRMEKPDTDVVAFELFDEYTKKPCFSIRVSPSGYSFVHPTGDTEEMSGIWLEEADEIGKKLTSIYAQTEKSKFERSEECMRVMQREAFKASLVAEQAMRLAYFSCEDGDTTKRRAIIVCTDGKGGNYASQLLMERADVLLGADPRDTLVIPATIEKYDNLMDDRHDRELLPVELNAKKDFITYCFIDLEKMEMVKIRALSSRTICPKAGTGCTSRSSQA